MSFWFVMIIFALSFIVFLSSCKTLNVPTYKGPKSDHFDGKRFFNPPPFSMGKFKDLRKGNKDHKRVKWHYQVRYPSKSLLRRERISGGELHFTHINHASVLLQMDSLNILTDPIFSKRASPFQFAGPKRYREPGLDLNELPKIDYVYISHDHYDHLDIQSLKDLMEKDNPLILVGLGLKAFLAKFDIHNVKELDWWEAHEDKDGMKFHFLPARHWSNRGFRPRKSLWGSMMFEGSVNVYHAGDTAYGTHFLKIKEKFKDVYLSFIPIGAYVPREFMRKIHMDPADAVKAHQDLESQWSFGIHWGTFQLTQEGMFDPAEELKNVIKDVEADTYRKIKFSVNQEPGRLNILKY